MPRKTIAMFLVLLSATIAFGIQASAEWFKFTSPDGRFSFLMPHEPKFEAGTGAETKEPTNYRYVDMEPGFGLICEYFEVGSAPTDVESFLDATRDGIIRGAGATKVSEEKIILDGYPGREVQLALSVPAGANMTARTRIYIVGKRLYSLTYVRVNDIDAKLASETAAKFFSSFKVTPVKEP